MPATPDQVRETASVNPEIWKRTNAAESLDERRTFARRSDNFIGVLEDGFINDKDPAYERMGVYIGSERKKIKAALEKGESTDVSMEPFLVLAATHGASYRENLSIDAFDQDLRPETESRMKAADEFFMRGAQMVFGSDPISPDAIATKIGGMIRGLDALKTPGMPVGVKMALEAIRSTAPRLVKEDPAALLDRIQKLGGIESLNGDVMEYNQSVLLPRLADPKVKPEERRNLLWDAQRLAKMLYELRLIEKTVQNSLPSGVAPTQAERMKVDELREQILSGRPLEASAAELSVSSRESESSLPIQTIVIEAEKSYVDYANVLNEGRFSSQEEIVRAEKIVDRQHELGEEYERRQDELLHMPLSGKFLDVLHQATRLMHAGKEDDVLDLLNENRETMDGIMEVIRERPQERLTQQMARAEYLQRSILKARLLKILPKTASVENTSLEGEVLSSMSERCSFIASIFRGLVDKMDLNGSSEEQRILKEQGETLAENLSLAAAPYLREAALRDLEKWVRAAKGLKWGVNTSIWDQAMAKHIGKYREEERRVTSRTEYELVPGVRLEVVMRGPVEQGAVLDFNLMAKDGTRRSLADYSAPGTIFHSGHLLKGGEQTRFAAGVGDALVQVPLHLEKVRENLPKRFFVILHEMGHTFQKGKNMTKPEEERDAWAKGLSIARRMADDGIADLFGPKGKGGRSEIIQLMRDALGTYEQGAQDEAFLTGGDYKKGDFLKGEISQRSKNIYLQGEDALFL